MYRDPKAQKKVYSTQAIQKAIHDTLKYTRAGEQGSVAQRAVRG